MLFVLSAFSVVGSLCCNGYVNGIMLHAMV